MPSPTSSETLLTAEAWTLLAAAVLVVLPATWRRLSYLITLVHEAGHAFVALSSGRQLNGIRLHRDTSGITSSVGRPHGPGMVLTAAAGYLAPTLLGLIITVLLRYDRARWALFVSLAMICFVGLFIRNWYGGLITVAAGLGTGLLIWQANREVQETAASVVAWLLLLGAVRATIDLWSHRRTRRDRTSDAAVLARLTHLPATVWNLIFVVVCAGAALWAIRTLG